MQRLLCICDGVLIRCESPFQGNCHEDCRREVAVLNFNAKIVYCWLHSDEGVVNKKWFAEVVDKMGMASAQVPIVQ